MLNDHHRFAELCTNGRSLINLASHPKDAHEKFGSWDQDVAAWLDREFPGSGMSAKWSCVSRSPLVAGLHSYYDDDSSWSDFRDAVRQRLNFLSEIAASQGSPADTFLGEPSKGRKVFLVHGHDEAAKHSVARFLEKLKLEPVILHEQPSQGRTIIEKFTDYSDVAFAVVLLTGDDVGGVKGLKLAQQKPRARQNVILELGFFLGKLGRHRVCALYESGVEIPSDFDGVVWVKLDEGTGWKFELAKELKAAQLPIDMNLVL